MSEKKTTVSIVDDETDLRESIIRYLNLTGEFHCVSDYARAEDALAKLPGEAPAVVLMDIKMEGMNGIDCRVGWRMSCSKRCRPARRSTSER